MFASSTSVTFGHTNQEVGRKTIVRTTGDGNVRTVKVRPGRSNQKRNAILASAGYGR